MEKPDESDKQPGPSKNPKNDDPGTEVQQERIKIGDVVYLQSGGAPMTVMQQEGRTGTPGCAFFCVWHGDDGEPYGQVYPESCLVPRDVMKARREKEMAEQPVAQIMVGSMPFGVGGPQH